MPYDSSTINTEDSRSQKH